MQAERIFAWAVRALILGAIIIFVFADALNLTFANWIAFALFGVGLIAGGIQALLTGRIELWKRNLESTDSNESVPASVWGIALICAGVTVLLGMVAIVFGLDQRVLRALGRFAETDLGTRVIWLCIGIGVIVWGVISVATKPQDQSPLAIARSLPRRLFGVLIVLIGLIVVFVNFLSLVAPSWLDAFKTFIGNWLGGL